MTEFHTSNGDYMASSNNPMLAAGAENSMEAMFMLPPSSPPPQQQQCLPSSSQSPLIPNSGNKAATAPVPCSSGALLLQNRPPPSPFSQLFPSGLLEENGLMLLNGNVDVDDDTASNGQESKRKTVTSEQQQKRHFCPQCELCYARRHSLTRHMRMKHGAGAVVVNVKHCPLSSCRFSTINPLAMAAHRRNHQHRSVGKPLYFCKSCKIRYSKRSSMLNHLTRKHAGDPMLIGMGQTEAEEETSVSSSEETKKCASYNEQRVDVVGVVGGTSQEMIALNEQQQQQKSRGRNSTNTSDDDEENNSENNSSNEEEEEEEEEENNSEEDDENNSASLKQLNGQMQFCHSLATNESGSFANGGEYAPTSSGTRPVQNEQPFVKITRSMTRNNGSNGGAEPSPNKSSHSSSLGHKKRKKEKEKTRKKAFVCDQCSYSCATFGSLYSHKRRAHEGQTTLVKCVYCPRRFKAPHRLVAHMKAQHTAGKTAGKHRKNATDKRQYSCKSCEFTTTTKRVFVAHRKMHQFAMEKEEEEEEEERRSSTQTPTPTSRLDGCHSSAVPLLNVKEEYLPTEIDECVEHLHQANNSLLKLCRRREQELSQLRARVVGVLQLLLPATHFLRREGTLDGLRAAADATLDTVLADLLVRHAAGR